MSSANPSRILLFAPQSAAAQDVQPVLEQAGFQVEGWPLDAAEPESVAGYQAVVLEGSNGNGAALQLCRRLRARLAEGFVPIMVLGDAGDPGHRLASLDAGADAHLQRPFGPDELLAQVRAFLRIKELHDRLAEKSAEFQRVNLRLQAAYQQIDDELELAHRLQTSFLPQVLPEVPRVRLAVHYRLCGQVGGDFYDAFRLDESHVGFYVADAMGHGLPASLLTIFVKKGVLAKEIFGKQYRLVPPNEVLQRLNRELVELALSEQPFITMVYALFNFQTGTVHYARAGHPHPLYVPRDGQPCFWQVPGSLLGVFETEYAAQTQRLRPGDKLLLYSDGVEGVSFEGHAPGADSLLACAARHRELAAQPFVDRLALALHAAAEKPDDLTLLGLEMLG